jgi:protein tyrosine/serine phosphatase
MYNFRKVSEKLYRSSAPDAEDVIWLNKKVGIKRIISLDAAAGKKIALSCSLLGIEHIMLPIDIGKKTSLIVFLDKIGKLLDNPKKTLIHCLHGKDRTGLAIGLYRCEKEGWTADDAIKEAKTFGFGQGLDPKVVELYKSFILDADKNQDVNSASDIVDGSRESYDDYFGAPSENLSWSPYGDRNVHEFPQTSTSLNDAERNPLGGFGPSVVGGGSTTI